MKVITKFKHKGKDYSIVEVKIEKVIDSLSGAAPWKIGTKYISIEYKLYSDGEYIMEAIYNKKFPYIGISQMKDSL